MHYYKHNIADYRKDTTHLSHLEHGIYRQLLDEYYLNENPLKTESVMRRLRIQTDEEQKAVQNVLNDFFAHDAQDDVWRHTRVDEELHKYQDKAETARANGKRGGRPKHAQKTKPVNSGNPEESKSKANSLTKELNNSLTKELIISAFERFWCAGLRKVNRKRAEPLFEKILIQQDDPMRFVEMLVQDIKARVERNQLGFDNLHPTTYLNNERWNDDLPPIQKDQGKASNIFDLSSQNYTEGSL